MTVCDLSLWGLEFGRMELELGLSVLFLSLELELEWPRRRAGGHGDEPTTRHGGGDGLEVA